MLKSYFETFGHKCNVDLDKPFEHVLENKSKLHKWFFKYAVISPNHILFRSHPRSHAALRSEMLYQMEHFRYTLHPFSVFIYYFDFIWMVAAFFWFFIDPVLIFDHIFPEQRRMKPLIYIEVGLAVILIIDCIRRFFSGHLVKGSESDEIVLDFRPIAITYLKSYFLIDLIPSIMPFIIITYQLEPNYHLACDILSLLRIFRLHSLNQVIINVMRFYHINYTFIEMFSGSIFLFLIVHWVSILSVLPGIIERCFNPNLPQWYDEFITPHSPFMSTYLLCGNRIMGTLTGKGYYFIFYKTKSESEMLYTIFSAVLGHILTLLIFAKLFEIVNGFGSATGQYEEMWREMSNYMKHHKLSKKTQKKIKTYYTYKYQYSFFSERELMSSLPCALQQTITIHNSKYFIENMGYLKELPTASVANIVACMAKEIVLPGDIIVRSGETGSYLYFVLSGTVALFSLSGWEVCHQDDGSEFGEYAVINNEARHVCTAVAIETTELYKLHSADFFALLDYGPDVVNLMEKAAIHRSNIVELIEQRFKQVYDKNVVLEEVENDVILSERSKHIWQFPEEVP